MEDNPGDVRLIQEGLKTSRTSHRTHVAGDGTEAMEFLKASVTGGPQPDLILLDLNLPRVDGRQVLAALKNHPQWRRIPVVVLTSSSAEEDIVHCYEQHANSYVVKPLDASDFMDAILDIDEYWSQTASILPRS